ncbi:hypothetical protein CSA37_09425 [Candidatus Fermentibacteria bacterium]|nr:MAG: hypothetical protein CSA37_09425 [Candidatus Fermentibacteria bacterium]
MRSRWNLFSKKAAAKALEPGLLIRPVGSVLCLLPPLTPTADETDEMTGIFRETLVETLN